MAYTFFNFKTPVFSDGHVYGGYYISLTNKDPVIVNEVGTSCSIVESNGYKYISLKNHTTGNLDRLPLGPLILSTFKSLPPLYELDYIDGNTLNANLSNLRWVPSIKSDFHPFHLVNVSLISLRTRPLIDSTGKQYVDYSIFVSIDGNCQIQNSNDNKPIDTFIENNKVFVFLGESNEKVLFAELVLSSFVSKKPEYLCDYINGQVNDNNISNLAWVTQKTKTHKRINRLVASPNNSNFSFLPGEYWKEIGNTGVYLSTRGREAIKSRDGLYLKKARRARVNGNIRTSNPNTMKLVDLHVLVAELFLSPRPSENLNYVVVRKPGRPKDSNALNDLKLIDSSIKLTYTYMAKDGTKYKNVSERVVLSQIRMGKKGFKALSEFQINQLNVWSENSNEVEVKHNYVGCFQIKDHYDFSQLFKNFTISDNKAIDDNKDDVEDEKEDEDNQEEEACESSDIEDNEGENKKKRQKYDQVLQLDDPSTIEKLEEEEYKNRLRDFIKSKNKYKKTKTEFKNYQKSIHSKYKIHNKGTGTGERRKRASSI